MVARALVVMAVVMVTQMGCGDGSTAPTPDIDPLLVGSWVFRDDAFDESTGVLLCTYVAMRLVLSGNGHFDWDTVDSPAADACDAPTYRKDSGDWHVQDGSIVFAPPPMDVAGATLELSYELVGNTLHVGPLLFERE